MSNPNNCATCGYKDMAADDEPANGHCYMFEHEPNGVCMQHTGRMKVAVIDPAHGRTNLSALVLLAHSIVGLEPLDLESDEVFARMDIDKEKFREATEDVHDDICGTNHGRECDCPTAVFTAHSLVCLSPLCLGDEDDSCLVDEENDNWLDELYRPKL